jgi:phosphomannomutase
MIAKVFKAYDVRAIVPDPLERRSGLENRQRNSSIPAHRPDRLRPQRRCDEQADRRPRHAQAQSGAFRRPSSMVRLRREHRSIDIGMIDTPQLYFATNHMPCCGGVQTTASHNPSNYNGFKICGPGGKPIGSETGLKEIQRIAEAVSSPRGARYPSRRSRWISPSPIETTCIAS